VLLSKLWQAYQADLLKQNKTKQKKNTCNRLCKYILSTDTLTTPLFHPRHPQSLGASGFQQNVKNIQLLPAVLQGTGYLTFPPIKMLSHKTLLHKTLHLNHSLRPFNFQMMTIKMIVSEIPVFGDEASQYRVFPFGLALSPCT